MQIIKVKRKMGGKFKFQDTVSVLRRVVMSNRINFLIGSGFSYPPLMPQGNIALVLRVLKSGDPRYLRLKAYLLWNYFLRSIYPLIGLNLDVSPQKEFTHAMKAILSNSEIKLLTKQINVFTTNYDPLFELGFDKKDEIRYNDGMEGKTVPMFSIDNYKELKADQTIYHLAEEIVPELAEMPDITERPTLNVFKLHGSLTWKMNPANYTLEYRDYHAAIFEFYNRFKDTFNSDTTDALDIPIRENLKEKAILKLIKKHFSGHDKKLEGKEESFIEAFFNTFVIVDPFIRKFHTEAVETHYFKLLKLMSSELEKEKAALFIFGFSFRDDHIRHIIEHQLKNDNLKVYIFCYDEAEIVRAETFFGSFGDKMHLITPIKSNFTLTDFNDLLNLINTQ